MDCLCLFLPSFLFNLALSLSVSRSLLPPILSLSSYSLFEFHVEVHCNSALIRKVQKPRLVLIYAGSSLIGNLTRIEDRLELSCKSALQPFLCLDLLVRQRPMGVFSPLRRPREPCRLLSFLTHPPSSFQLSPMLPHTLPPLP